MEFEVVLELEDDEEIDLGLDSFVPHLAELDSDPIVWGAMVRAVADGLVESWVYRSFIQSMMESTLYDQEEPIESNVFFDRLTTLTPVFLELIADELEELDD